MFLKKKTAEARVWHNLLCESLNIEPARLVVINRWPPWMEEPSSTRGMIFFEEDFIMVRFNSRTMTDRDLIGTIAHETYHLFQVRKGAIYAKDNIWFYKHKKIESINKMPWSKRPHEIAAIRYAKKVINNLEEKDRG